MSICQACIHARTVSEHYAQVGVACLGGQKPSARPQGLMQWLFRGFTGIAGYGAPTDATPMWQECYEENEGSKINTAWQRWRNAGAKLSSNPLTTARRNNPDGNSSILFTGAQQKAFTCPPAEARQSAPSEVLPREHGQRVQ